MRHFGARAPGIRVAVITGVLGVVASAAPAGMQDILLDTFDGPLGALGQARTLDQIVDDNPLGVPDPLVTGVLESEGHYVFEAGPQVDGRGFIIYDEFPGPIDAIALGIVGFELDFKGVDQAFLLSIELATLDAQGQAIGTAMATSTVGAGDGEVFSDLADFAAMGSFDATNIGRVILEFNIMPSTSALDFALNEFRARVPAPGVLAIAGIAGVTIRRRRRGNQ